MAKKRKASGAAKTADAPADWESRKKVAAINSFEDIADSEDEFHINRDKILLDEGPEAKRRRKWEEEEAELEPSDDEILGYDEDSDEDEEEEEEQPRHKKSDGKKSGKDAEDEEDDEEDAEGWGSSKRDYYDADNIETEEQALEEEAEAKRIQQKKLQKMSAADFGLDEDEWLDGGDKDNEDDAVVTEVLQDVEITEDMTAEDRIRLLNTRYPEFEFLANEFATLHPLLQDLTAEAQTAPQGSPVIIKARALAAYLGCLSMYFALFSSPSKINGKPSAPLSATELHDHDVMKSLLETRNLWNRVKNTNFPSPSADSEAESEPEEIETAPEPKSILKSSNSGRLTKKEKKALKLAKAKEEAAEQMRAKLSELDDLNSLIPKTKSTKAKKPAVQDAEDDSASDFGEEEVLDDRTASEKASRKKSLRFYTSEITQKANKRADAGRHAGGDDDLPYRERLKDRQARLNAEAERRGKALDSYGRGKGKDSTALEGEDDDDEGEVAQEVREGEDDEYYQMISRTTASKKAAKAAQRAELEAAKAGKALERVDEEDADGKRAIGYVIEKNKGLAPKRKKEVRNPRVKKRMKYDEKKKKLASVRQVYKGGEGKGYGGELTGIKTNLVKSVKL